MNLKKPKLIFKIIFALTIVAIFNLNMVLASSLYSIASNNRSSFSTNYPGSLYFSPSSGTFPGCSNQSISFYINTGGIDSNAFDTKIYFDPNVVEIIDSNSSRPGVQVITHNSYQGFVSNTANNSTGTITLAAASITSNLNGVYKIATIQFRTKMPQTNTEIKIAFNGTGSTIDSNIAKSSDSSDFLGSVINGSYSINTGNCIVEPTSTSTPIPSPTFPPTSIPSATPEANNVNPETTNSSANSSTSNNSTNSENDSQNSLIEESEDVSISNNLELNYSINSENKVYLDWEDESSKFTIKRDGIEIGESASGSFLDQTDLDEGAYTYELWQNSKKIVSIEIYLTSDIERIEDNFYYNVISDNKIIDNTGNIEIIGGEEIVFSGITLPNKNIVLNIDGNSLSTKSDENGLWEILVESNQVISSSNYTIFIDNIEITSGQIIVSEEPTSISNLLLTTSIVLIFLVLILIIYQIMVKKQTIQDILLELKLIIFPVHEKSLIVPNQNLVINFRD